MSMEHSPVRFTAAATRGNEIPDADYWHSLIDENEAATFLNLSARTLQGLRYRGGGPPFVRISSRCLKYRRLDCRNWAESRLRTSTSDRRPKDA